MIFEKVNILFHNLKLRYKLIISFTLICFISLLLFSIITITIYKDIIVQKESKSILENISSFKLVLNQYLEDVDRSSIRIAYSTDALNVFNSDPDKLVSEARMQAFYNLNKRIQEVITNAYGIMGIYIIDNYNNTFSVDTSGNSIAPILTDKDNINRKWYKDMVKSNGAACWTIVDWYGGTKTIALTREIFDWQTNKKLGMCVITVSPGFLEKSLLNSDMKDGIYCIVDKNGQIYSEKSFENLDSIIDIKQIRDDNVNYTKKVGNKDYLATYTEDTFTGWCFVHIVNKSSLFKEVVYINKVWIIIFIISFTAVTAISFLIARTISNPLNKLIGLIRDVEKGNLKVEFNSLYTDEIGSLGKSFNKMVGNIREGIPLKREKFLRAILESNLEKEEFQVAKEAIDIPFTENYFQVVVLTVDEVISENISKKIENDIVDFERAGYNIVSITLKNGQYCVISNYSQEETYELTQKIVEAVHLSLGIDVKAFLGNNYDDLFMIKNSYEEAKTLIKYKFFSNPCSIYLNNDFVNKGSWKFSYPDNYENRLLYHIEERNLESCENVICEVKEFFKKNSTDPSIISMFISNIYINIYKVVVKTGISPENLFGSSGWEGINLKHTSGAIDESFIDLTEILKSFFEQTKSIYNENSITNINIRKAIEVIKKEYSNPDMCIDYLAKKIFLNENYFSQLFSKEMGESFTDYLGKIRVQEAKKLLSELDLKVKDVSAAVGFADPHYFGTWFKEITGLSPSQYRKQ